jgi:general nucleoside transport system permease protein
MGDMSAIAVPAGKRISVKRARGLGVFFVLLAIFMVGVFGLSTRPGLQSTFGLNTGGEAVKLPSLVLPTQTTVFAAAGICAFLGATQLTRGFGKRAYFILAIAVLCFVFAFLTWAVAGDSMNLTGMLESTLLRAVPLTLGALSGVLCERSGVINIAIEGMMLTAAFTGAVIGSVAGNWLGLMCGVLSGALLGWGLAVLAIRYRVDQIIAGTVLNIFALGMTSYLAARVLEVYPALNNPHRFPVFALPVLAKVPILGPIFFTDNVFIYLMYVLIAVVYVGLFRTRWGLRVRAVGENPLAADTVGVNPLGVRYLNVVLGGMVAGLAGAYFTLGSVGQFDQNMTAGRGFIALAAMIFGRWNPIGAFGAALVFGFADSLQTKLAILNVSIPSEFLLMAPYVATILVVAGVVGRARPPAADGRPYIKE